MKKIFISLALAGLAAIATVSCQYGEDEVSNPVDKAAEMTISVDYVADDTCSFTIAPSGKALFYSYSVKKTSSTEAPDAASLYSCSAGGIKKGTFKYAIAESATVELENLDKNSDYVIFAVAGSPEGVVGKVTALSFHTTDTANPSVKSVSVEQDDILVLTFDEAVTNVSGKGITVDVYAPASYMYQAYRYPADKISSFTLKDGESAGYTVAFKLPEKSYVSGALLAVSYAEGTFVDEVGLPAGAKTSYVFGNYYTSEGWYPETYGLVAETSSAWYELGDAEPIGDISAIFDAGGNIVPVLIFNLGEGIGWYLYSGNWNMYPTMDWGDDYAIGSVRYEKVTEDGRTSYKEMDLSSDDADEAFYSLWYDEPSGEYFGCVYLNVEPLPGDEITITVPEYAYLDIYGNVNEEKTYTVTYKGE